MSRASSTLEEIAARIADDEVVDWRLLNRLDGRRSAAGDGLRELADLAQAFRGAQQSVVRPPEGEPIFRFGPLDVYERLAGGAQAETYRAHDRMLDLPVALKLRPEGSDVLAHRFLDEARRMARVRDSNVVQVLGAAREGGRVGLWTEWLQGETLAQESAAREQLAHEDLLSIGRELARALGVVHARGLVHGDLKASNVMRCRDGRIVLMDFGCAHDLGTQAGGGVLHGTPAYLAPEGLAGAAPTPASDHYALGVLLFRLASGRFPSQARDLEGLREEHRQGTLLRLGALRPDLPLAFVAAIDRLLDPDPRRRPANAAGVTELLGTAGRGPAAWPWFAAAAASLLVALAMLALPASGPVVPPWSPGIALHRLGGDGNSEQLVDGAAVALGDRLVLKLASDRRTWAYVFNDDGSGPAVLFPLEADGQRNPLEGAPERTLPGLDARGRPLAWQISANAASEEFVIVLADAPVVALEQAISSWRRATEGQVPGETRGAARLVPAPSPRTADSAALREALSRLDPDANAHWRIWRLRLPHAR